MEKFVYEHRPHFYALLGVASYIYLKDSSFAYLATTCALMLMFCSLHVFRIRHAYRARYGHPK